MLARRSQLRLPDGSSCDLPLLVPSFSSKGFGFSRTKIGKSLVNVSDASADLHDFGQTPSSCTLISAFDLHFRHFRLHDERRRSCLDWVPNCRVIFVDSGGYELAPDFDTSEPKSPSYTPPSDYGRDQYVAVLETLRKRAERANIVVPNFDWGTRGDSLTAQISDARALKRRHGHMLHSFILKPWSHSTTIVDPRKLSPSDIADLGGFDIIGVTEKELGTDLIDRLRRISQLRLALNQNHIAAPIHVWGGLDPLLTPLYFFAGAEIFDGVSWLRYAYVDGLAVNREAAPVLDPEVGVDARRNFARPMTAMRNRSFLDRMSACLQQWVDLDGRDFRMFPNSTRDHLSRAYETMLTTIPEMKESRHGR
jgi:hypothetical protein